MDTAALEDAGMSPNEAKAYLALLELGPATAGQVADRCAVHRPSAYDALDRLVEKGLVSYLTVKGVKRFEAQDPNRLLDLFALREARLKSLLPTLLLHRRLASKAEVTVSEGAVAGRNLMLSFLEQRKDILMYGVPTHAAELLGKFFLDRWQRERIARGVAQRIVYEPDAAERIMQLKRLKGCIVRVMPKGTSLPMSVNICGDEVFFGLFTRDPALFIRFQGSDIAAIFTGYFEVMWSLSRPA